MLLPDADATFARQVGERILGSLERPFMVQRLPIEVSASVGMAVAPEHGTEAETLLRHADSAVQAARKLGGGASVLYSASCELHDPARLALLGELRRALDGNELQLHYQPKVDLKTRTVVGAEALLRWAHPKRGFVSPAEFIPLAERDRAHPAAHAVGARPRAGRGAGLGAGGHAHPGGGERLGAQPPRRADRRRRRGGAADPRPAAGAAAGRGDGERGDGRRRPSRRRALPAHGRGVAVSIDDFGTGYSSLGLLRRLPVHELKIDKSFVMGMAGDGGEDTAIVRSTADLAHNLGLNVVAEGRRGPVDARPARHLRLRPGPGLPHRPADGRRPRSPGGWATPRGG